MTDEELLEYLVLYEIENDRSPTSDDLTNNRDYPSFNTYADRFGSFGNAKKLVGQDLDSMIRKGIIENTKQKGRLAEMYVLENLEKGATDLSGENCKSFADGKSKIRMADT